MFLDENKRILHIVLTSPGTVIARIIKTCTKEPYAHVSLALDTNLREMYSFGRKKIYNPLNGGFVHESTKRGIYALYNDTKCSIYSLEVTSDQYEKIRKLVRDFANNGEHYKYNYLGIVGVMVNIPIKIDKRYFCSEFVAEVLEHGGVKLFDKRPALVTPQDFRVCRALELIYTGKLNEYCR